MSTIKTTNVQLGTSGTASNNFVLAVPGTPNGTVKLSRGNQGATTDDVMSIANDNGVSFLRLRQNIIIVGASTTATAGKTYVCTATMTLTLPSSPQPGDMVGFSNRSGTTTIVIGRGGQNIMGLAEDMTVDSQNASFTLVFADATRGWIVI